LFCLGLLLSAYAYAQFDPAAEHRILDQANQARNKAGLPPLHWDNKLAQAARTHAEKMAEGHSLSHRLQGEADLTDRIAATGLRFSSVSENIAYSTDAAEDFHDDWMRSPGHRANILAAKSDALGVAVLNYKGTFYAVEDFAKAIEADSPATAESRFVAEFNRVRVRLREARAQINPDAALRSAACAMADKDAADARRIPHQQGSRGTVAFTASEPEDLPKTILELARDPRFEKLSVGTCFKATPNMPGGTYWFAVVY
jgi:hypothetical protein